MGEWLPNYELGDLIGILAHRMIGSKGFSFELEHCMQSDEHSFVRIGGPEKGRFDLNTVQEFRHVRHGFSWQAGYPWA